MALPFVKEHISHAEAPVVFGNTHRCRGWLSTLCTASKGRLLRNSSARMFKW
jgi:hypothetical protein